MTTHVLTASCKHMVTQTHGWQSFPQACRARGHTALHRLLPRCSTQHQAQLPNKVTGALNYQLTFQWGKLPVKTR